MSGSLPGYSATSPAAYTPGIEVAPCVSMCTRGEPERRDDRVDLEHTLVPGAVVEQHDPFDVIAALDATDLMVDEHLDVGGHQPTDGRGMGTEPFAAVGERPVRRDALEREGPVHSAVAAPDDQDALPAERIEFAEEVDESPALPLRRTGERTGRERADAAGDQHGPRLDDGPSVRRQPESGPFVRGVDPRESFRTLSEQVGRPVGSGLLDAGGDEVPPDDRWEAGDVVDGLLRVQRGDLPAGLRERVDDHDGEATETRVVGAVQARRTGPDDREVGAVELHRPPAGSGLRHPHPPASTESSRPWSWKPREGWRSFVSVFFSI
jgi:hypothetical protein